MILTGNYNYRFISNFVNKPMFLCYSLAPITAEFVFEWFGFSCSFKRFFSGSSNQFDNFMKELFIKALPSQKLLVSNRFKKYLSHFFRYLSISTSMSLPSLTFCSDSSNIFRLVSLCKRYSVSSNSSSTVIEIVFPLYSFFKTVRNFIFNSLVVKRYVVVILSFFKKIQIINFKYKKINEIKKNKYLTKN